MLWIPLPKSVFGIDAIPNTDQNWRYAVWCISIHSNPMTAKFELIRCCVSKIPKGGIHRFS